MPKAPLNDSIARIVELMFHLAKFAEPCTTKDLCDKLGDDYPVSRRTVERNLKLLAELRQGVVLDDSSKPYRWHWQGLELPVLAVKDALSLRIIEDLLRPLLPKVMLEALEPRFELARRQLDLPSGSGTTASWVHKVCHVQPAQPLIPPKIDPSVLETIQDSLLNDRQVEVRYQGASAAEPIDMRLHPLALVQRGPVTYLVATASLDATTSLDARDYKEPRKFALHRVLQATATKRIVHRPMGFSLKQHIEEGNLQFGDGKELKIEANISAELARILRETPLTVDQCLAMQEGRWRLSATVQNTWQLGWWILSQGPNIEVLKPLTLRKKIADDLLKASSQYDDQNQ